MSDLTTALKQDEKLMKESLKEFTWFHRNINRNGAEAHLKKEQGKDGAFLVRESHANPADFVLSVMKNKKFAHFVISERRSLHCLYSLTGPDGKDDQLITGIEQLITHYKSNKGPLPVKLKYAVKHDLPPPLSFQRSYTNLLHKALSEGDVSKAQEILSNPNCPDVNMKNAEGSLPIHLAAGKGNEVIVRKLIEKSAEVSAPDGRGNTALHLASAKGDERVARYLVEFSEASVNVRNHTNANMPLHDAAANGHTGCVKCLLSLRATPFPFNSQQLTPLQLAQQNGHSHIVNIFDDYKPSPAIVKAVDWNHGPISRQDAQALLQKHGLEEGLFLVRESNRPNVAFVLQLAFKKQDISYQVFTVSIGNIDLYRIEEGPLFPSIEHLIEFHCVSADGLCTNLKKAVSPDGHLVPMLLNATMEDDYYNSTLLPCVKDSGVTEYMVAGPSLTRNGPVSATKRSLYRTPSMLLKKKFKGHVLEKENLIVEYELGQGEFGSVLKGTWMSPCGQNVQVAIKTLHENVTAADKNSFLSEAEVMVKLDHPCIVSFIGVCQGPPLMLVQELVELGSLLDYLLDYKEKIDVQRDLMLWAAQISCGMLYLESQHFVHRDLATRNILLASKQQAKVGDFGLSRMIDTERDYYKATQGGRWPVRWYAPEAVNYGTFSHASDVWSFGVTLWEMYTFGDQPYEDKTGSQVVAYLEAGHRLEKPDYCPRHIYQVMLDCWKYQPEKRITFRKLLDTLNEECSKIGQMLINPGGTHQATNA